MTSQVLPLHAPMTSNVQALRLQLMAVEHLERIGNRMRTRREELHLTRREVAERVGGKTNENSIYRWEKAKHAPEADTLERIATALEVDVSYFVVASGNGKPTPDVTATLSTDRGLGQAGEIVGLLTEIRDGLKVFTEVRDALNTLNQWCADVATEDGAAVRMQPESPGFFVPPPAEDDEPETDSQAADASG